MNRQEYQRSIINSLSWLSTEVSLSNSMNFTDINVHSEYFYRDLLNLAFGYKLININILEANSAAIDLGDLENKFAIQVTSTSKLEKTKKTVDKFIEKKLFEKYDHLVILNITEKTVHKAPTLGNENYTLDTKKDIWDIYTLATRFNDLGNEKLEEIHGFLNEELYKKPKESLPKDTTTILKLMELISDEKHPEVGEGYIIEPFPEHKIHERFAEHSDFLTEEYVSLYQDYGAVLDAVEKISDFGQVRIRRAAQHLRTLSDSVLTQCEGNPKEALDKLLSHFIGLLQNHGFDADTGAAQFYILKQLISCNVFPNKEVINH
ncbi:MAG: hypothetical protein ACJAS1_004247 [Oleiphilaceae bacterium]|jgi:hypothetical protein